MINKRDKAHKIQFQLLMLAGDSRLSLVRIAVKVENVWEGGKIWIKMSCIGREQTGLKQRL